VGSPRQLSTIVFIINPKAGTKSSDLLADQIERNLDRSRFRYSLLYTEHAGHGHELAKSAVDNEVAAVIAVGGDGTMNECATALIGSNTVLGLIPMGSGNGLARDLRIPLEIRKSIQVINGFKCRSLDCGVVNGDYFFCTAGIGFDAWVSRKFQQQKARGFRGYMNIAIKEFTQYRCSTYNVEFNSTRKQVKAFSIT
jgi:diacylglycerol kinase family enzyme